MSVRIRGKKEVLYPIFEECSNIVSDEYWKSFYDELSYGKTPKSLYISNGTICTSNKRKSFTYSFTNKQAKTVAKELHTLILENTNLYSNKDLKKKKLDMELAKKEIEKKNAADEGFNLWSINGVSFPNTQMAPASYHLKKGKRYRIRMRNASDDIHPIHLHRHSFELASLAGKPTGGILKDVLMLGGYQEAEIDFVADNPGLTLFHCHQQLHMDFGLMSLFDYV